MKIIFSLILLTALSLQYNGFLKYRHHKLKKISHRAKFKMLSRVLQNDISDALHSLAERRLTKVNQDGKY